MASVVAFERKHVGRLVPKNPNLLYVVCVGIAVVNEATLGYDASMMNGLNILPQYTDFFHLTTATIGLNNAGIFFGGTLGAFFIQPVADGLGRKAGILIGASIALVGVILQTAAQNIGMFILGRIILGIGPAISTGAVPPLLSEVLPAKHRGKIMGFFFSCFYVGSLVSAGINYRAVNISGTWAWRLPSIFQAFWSIMALVTLPFIPESPRWLLEHGQRDAARETLAVIYGHGDPNDEQTTAVLAEIENVLHKEHQLYPGNPWKEMFASKANRHRMAIIVIFGVMIQMLGDFVISFYLGSMLTQAGITDPITQLEINIILSCWSFVVAVSGSLLLDVFGRRRTLIVCLIGMIVTLYIFGGMAKLYGTGSTNKSGIYGTIAFIFLYQGFYAFSVSPMTSLYPPEVLNLKLRTAGNAVFRFLNYGFGLLAAFTMSYAMDDLGYKFYFINASWDILFLVLVYLLFIETARVPLEEVALRFGDIHVEDLGDGVEVVESVSVEPDLKERA
ncbi:hypothetical protein A1O3_07814 [Capronia epimyces CBS 606.96]|uniref:Major facilitator superfamily (MFS) profile domain-containing protein n=1 Tax=Capronia epimyces CBS 606.96 TaxID=1182542 RepID=W9XQD5_9EURO|nr:uncharacterized protein A1O3_07814 [Capronia epimyces CBS 606.96]EXJ79535.1 hypothetical protein A1O3_07814 [Capronia epimyces CBS 606.96]